MQTCWIDEWYQWEAVDVRAEANHEARGAPQVSKYRVPFAVALRKNCTARPWLALRCGHTPGKLARAAEPKRPNRAIPAVAAGVGRAF